MMSSCYELNTVGDDDVLLGQEHEVFLSFRGSDTRNGFTDYLYRSLYNAGVRVFRDNENLHVGEEIGPQLVRGITQSKISIPIFSKNYADSKWCLKEFALMMECRRTMKQLVLPVFYDVTPNEVQHQIGKFQEAFDGHENKYGVDTVQQWRNALSEVGSLKGWELEKAAAGHEAELVEMVVEEVMKKLKKAHIVLKDSVIGIEEQVNAVMQLLEVGSNDVRVIGIWGMGGIGKTTLANAVYNQIVDQFECFGFLENIREKSSQPHGLESLQSVLVSKLSRNDYRDFRMVNDGIKELKDRFQGKKVLILLDDVDKKKQLEALGGRAGWFGRGSRIIVTTRDSGLFDKSSNKIYETKLMDADRALQLFCNHAFKTDLPPSELRGLSKEIVENTGGLPLALEVIGCFLAGQETEVWESVQEKLQNRPHEEVEHTLEISYDALSKDQKHIFLDIACFHVGEVLKVASYMWKDRFGFSPVCDVKVLELMSLIKIENGKLWMHDQLRDFGREVVEREKEESTVKPIRLWKTRTALELLRECTESPRVEAICLKNEEPEAHFTDEEFRNLPKLRFIRLYGADLIGNFKGCLSNLRWLDWQLASFKCILTNVTLKNLVVLNLSYSDVSDDWSWSHTQVVVTLKVLDLCCCEKLQRAPDFSFFPKLERLQLRECLGLKEINSSIGKLKSLNYLNLWGCEALGKLPHEMKSLESLVELDVGYTGIPDLPISRYMKKLEILCATNCGNLSSVPNFIGELTSLRDLRLGSYCISELPESIGSLKKLQQLSLEGTSIWNLPESIGQLTSLVELHLAGSFISALPKSIGNLEKLEVIDASKCPPMSGEFPDIERLCNLKVLKINGACMSSLPETITSLSHLHTLHLDMPIALYNFHYGYRLVTIPSLQNLPQLPVGLISTVVTCGSAIPIPNLSHLTNLKELELHSCTGMMEMPWDFAKPLKLQKLCIVDCTELRQIENLPASLHELGIEGCSSLVEIQGLGDLITLTNLELKYCTSLQTLPSVSNLKSLKHLSLMYMEKLQTLEGLENLEELEVLNIRGLVDSKFPDLSNLKSLHKLNVTDCKSLRDLKGLDGLEALKHLNITECEAIEKLPNLSNLKFLERLLILDCKKLQDLEGLDSLEALKELSIKGCKAIKELPDLSNFKLLTCLHVVYCDRLQVLEGLDKLEALEVLNISGCIEIKELPDLSKLKWLWMLEAQGCEKLQDFEGLDGLEELSELNIGGCKAVRRLPNLSNLEQLRILNAEGCEMLQRLGGLEDLKALQIEELIL